MSETVDYQVIFADTPVVLAYLFGSQAEGRVHARSDVDVAVLLDEGLSPVEQGRWQLELISRLTDVWHTDHIDLIILNRAPAFLQHQVIKARHRLYVRDEAERVRFEVQAMRDWFDWQPYYSKLNKLWLQRV
jgi:hypothetical protein